MTELQTPVASAADAGRESVKERDGELAAACNAIADDVLLLARFADRELDLELMRQLCARPPRQWFSLDLTGKDVDEAFTLLEKGLVEFGDDPTAAVLDDHAAEYAAIYLTHNYRASPLESFWRDDEGLVRQQAMFAVRDFYARYGVSAEDWRKRSEDHLAYELSFLAALLRNVENSEELQGAADFLRKHLLVWNHLFARAVTQRCRLPFYAGIVLVTALYLDRLGELIQDITGIDMKAAELLLSAQALSPNGQASLSCGDTPKTAAK